MFQEWRPVVGYEVFYAVSSDGEVRSLERRVGARYGSTRVRGTRILSTFLDRNGYRRVRLTDAQGGKRFWKVHHLVAKAFLGERPEGLLVLHKDDDKFNNEVGNLYYGTHAQNAADAVRNGKHRGKGAHPGDRHHNSKLREADIPVIMTLKDQGMPLLRIAKRFGVTDMTIHDIVKGKTWTAQTGLKEPT